jgi:hypothetical protein
MDGRWYVVVTLGVLASCSSAPEADPGSASAAERDTCRIRTIKSRRVDTMPDVATAKAALDLLCVDSEAATATQTERDYLQSSCTDERYTGEYADGHACKCLYVRGGKPMNLADVIDSICYHYWLETKGQPGRTFGVYLDAPTAGHPGKALDISCGQVGDSPYDAQGDCGVRNFIGITYP